MARVKRSYPTEFKTSGIFCSTLLVLALLLVVSGVFSREGTRNFQLEFSPAQTAVPIEERFDETPAQVEFTLPYGRWYAIQLGAYSNEESALKTAQAYISRGAAGFVWNDDKYRVMAAAYPNETDARAVREQLREKHSLESYSYLIEFPSITLRLSGAQGQLDIVKAAFEHLFALTNDLYQISCALDRQEITASEVSKKLNTVQTQLDIVAIRLKQRFEPPYPDAVKSILDTFEAFSVFTEALPENEPLVTLATKLKHQHFAVLWNIKMVYHSLEYTEEGVLK